MCFGGQSGIAGHIKIGRKVTLAARGGIIRDVKDGEVLGGTPAVPIRQWHKQTAILKKLSQSEGSSMEEKKIRARLYRTYNEDFAPQISYASSR